MGKPDDITDEWMFVKIHLSIGAYLDVYRTHEIDLAVSMCDTTRNRGRAVVAARLEPIVTWL